MAKAKPSRLTERSHPRYRGGSSSAPSPVATDDQASRRFAMVALGGLALAAVLLVGFMMSRRGDGPDTAAAPTATVAAAAETTSVAVSTIPALTPAPSGVDGVRSTGAGRFTAPEDQAIDAAGKSYFVTWETPKGTIEAELWPEIAPITVNSFVFLARQGFYDGLTFHRVIDGFVAQGGDPLGTGLGGPGFGLPAELHAADPVPIGAGAVAMARVASRPDSAGSQFFIVTGDGQPARNLTGLYTVIGWVADGLDVAQALAEGDVIEAVTVRTRAAAGGGLSPDDIRARATEASR